MTESTLPPAVQALIDRQEILDCELRYCSGVDRSDREMLLSAYHPGAMDDHGAFVGTAEKFVDWAFAYRNASAPSVSLHGGRYLDRLEKRGGKWAIAARKCVIEWGGSLNDIGVPAEAAAAYALTGIASRDCSDPSYQRPSTIERGAFVLPFRMRAIVFDE